MTSIEKINNYFETSIQAKIETANALPPAIAQAAKAMVSCVENGGKILVCGNGGSANLAQHFSSKLLSHFQMERPPLPAIALTGDISTITAIGDNYGFAEIFSKLFETQYDYLLEIFEKDKDKMNSTDSVAVFVRLRNVSICFIVFNDESAGYFSLMPLTVLGEHEYKKCNYEIEL